MRNPNIFVSEAQAMSTKNEDIINQISLDKQRQNLVACDDLYV